MSTVIDIVLVLIVGMTTWRGFRNGFIRGLFGVVAIIIAIYGANLAAKAYASEFTGMFAPFVVGIVDKSVGDVLGTGAADAEDADPAQSEPDNTDSADEQPVLPDVDNTSVYDVCFKALRLIGVSEQAAHRMATKVDAEIDAIGQQMTATLTQRLSEALAYIAVFGISFILISIIFAVLGNVINLAFSLPGMELIDKIVGLVFGLAKGALIVLAIAVIVRYLGFISPETIDKTVILKYITNANPLAGILGI